MTQTGRPDLPVLREVLEPSPQLQLYLVQALPELVRQSLAELQPQLEQQLLDALLPRLLASLAEWQPPATPPTPSGSPRLP